MPVKTVVGGRLVVHIALLVAVLAGLVFLAGALDAALAQAGPFGAPRAQAPAPPMGGVLGWIFAKQAEFYRQFSEPDPRRQGRWQRGLGPVRTGVPVRRFSRRRPRSRQGGDLVLYGRE